jgi:glyceraldehyde 3-phosphate dehydrogenase
MSKVKEKISSFLAFYSINNSIMINIAINGFGRIGRQVYKALLETNFLDGTVNVVAVNDLVPADNIAYLLKYDTVHGRTDGNIYADGDMVHVGDKSFKVLAMKVTPAELPWSEYNVDIVIESTGFWTKKADAE